MHAIPQQDDVDSDEIIAIRNSVSPNTKKDYYLTYLICWQLQDKLILSNLLFTGCKETFARTRNTTCQEYQHLFVPA